MQSLKVCDHEYKIIELFDDKIVLQCKFCEAKAVTTVDGFNLSFILKDKVGISIRR